MAQKQLEFYRESATRERNMAAAATNSVLAEMHTRAAVKWERMVTRVEKLEVNPSPPPPRARP